MDNSGYAAALLTGPGELEWGQFSAAPPAPGAVTVAIGLCGICGSDVAAYRTGDGHQPAVFGHEWIGTVMAVGDGVAEYDVGDRVVVGVSAPCGTCAACRSGSTEHCRSAIAVASGRDALAPPHGGFAPYITVAAGRVLPLPPSLTDVEAAFVEPASVAFRGVRRARVSPGDTVVVQGAGPIGLLALQFAKVAGAGTVIVIEPSSARRERAGAVGADVLLEPVEADREIKTRTHGLGADIVIECSGVPGLLQTAVDLARPGGTVVLLSFSAQSSIVSTGKWLGKEITVVAAAAYSREDVVRTMSFISAGRVDVRALHTRTVLLSGLGTTLDELAQRADDVKILVDPRPVSH